MDKWEKLRVKENNLLGTEEVISEEVRKTSRIKEQYQEHFREAQQFLEECRYLFHKNDKPYFYESAMDEFSRESIRVLTHLEDSEQDMYRQKRKNSTRFRRGCL